MVATPFAGQSAPPQASPKAVFQRVRARLLDDLGRVPRYTCTQNITRRFFRSDLKSPQSCSAILTSRTERKHDLPLAVSDGLQLEVAVADQREVHSWPDASSFEEEDEIRKLIGNGAAFGSGDFAAFVGGIFGGPATIKFERELVVDGRSVFEYSFQVANSASRYQVDTKTGPVVTAYDGSFWLDPQGDDLVHLTVRTAELPKGTESCQAINEIGYGRIDIHGRNVLIPHKADLRIILRNGAEASTATSYSSCREFAAKAVLRFDESDSATKTTIQSPGRAPQESSADPFPAGFKFDCRILTQIDSGMPAGRPIEAILRSPIRDKKGVILAPRGSRIHGRLVRLAQHYSTYDFFEIGVRLESIEVNGAKRPLHASLVDQPLGPSTPHVSYLGSPEVMVLPTGLLPNAGEFFFVREHLHVRGLNSEWVTTLPPANRENQTAPRKLNTEVNTASGASENTQEEKIGEAAPASALSPAVVTPQQTSDRISPDKTPTIGQNSAEFRLKVESNLVVVRAVVRDAQGKPVENLGKEDFRLLDKGKEQSIAHFEVERSTPQRPGASPGKAEPTSSPAAPSLGVPSFMALYVDDLNTSDTDMMQAREAADRYFSDGLPANERVAIFTADDEPLDFTADLKQIHASIAKLHTSPRARTRVRDCPELSDYQAQQIAQFQDDTTIDAWKAALDDVAARCPQPDPPNNGIPSASNAKHMIEMMARQVLDDAEMQARSNLRQLERLVNYVSLLPGQRTIVLVSPGFLSESEQAQLDRIIDHALRMQVIISSLDPKGLALLMRETDITRGYTPSANTGAIGAAHNVDAMREVVATDVLAQLAAGTGGEFFHNNNDLKTGFDALAGSPVSYILAFVPKELDGKFHKLEVKLVQAKGSVQARRGYFAVNNGPEPDSQFASMNPNDDALRRVMASREEIRELSIDVTTDVAPSSGDPKELNIVVRLDLASVPFRKEGDLNVNTVTFVVGIYDNDGKWVNGEQKRFDLTLPDAQLKDMRASGVGVKNTFNLKPGKYLLREVVQDSEDHHLAALNQNVEIP